MPVRREARHGRLGTFFAAPLWWQQVASEIGATANHVVLAWLMGSDIPMIPLVGASSAAQLDESLAAVELELPDQRAALDAAS
jgi:aryl-alcohol dehydrogenase-like predicted oxidoreductase